MLVLELLAVPVLIALNAFFVAAEYAIVTIRATKIEELRQQGLHAALVLAKLKEDVSGSLATIQICITATNLVIGAVAEPALAALFVKALSPLGMVMPLSFYRPLALLLSLAIVTFFTVVLSELLPKALTLQYTEQIALFVARPIRICRWLCRPLVKMMDWTGNRITRAMGLGHIDIQESIPSEDELEIMVDRSQAAGEFYTEHGELVRRAFDFADLDVQHVMKPMKDVGVLDSNLSVDALAEKLSERPYTRWPIRDPKTGHITGIVNVKMALYAKSLSVGEAVILADLASAPAYLDPDLPLIDALEELRLTRSHIAVVRDDDGAEMGIVTLEDILASIVGHIPSEVRPPRPLRSKKSATSG